jgi:hypothetical protein
MATLSSPGVSVTISADPITSSGQEGTVPLVILATASNKTISGTVAAYTAPSKAGALFLATSQRELIQNFGVPTFKVLNGTPVHGSELNEYGLHTAYEFLGVSNRCYILRADIDLDQLEPSSSEPTGDPIVGTYWFDTSATSFGVFQSNGDALAGSAWKVQPVTVLDENNTVDVNGSFVPAANYGEDGDFAIVIIQSDNLLYEKIGGTWYHVGSADWKGARPTTVVGSASPANLLTTDTLVINGSTVDFLTLDSSFDGTLAKVVAGINAAAIANITATISGAGALVITNSTGGDITLANGDGTGLATLGLTAGTVTGVQFSMTNNAQYPTTTTAGSVWVKGSPSNNGAKWTVKYYASSTGWTVVSAPFYPFNSLLADGSPSKDLAATNALQPVSGTLYVGYDAGNGTQQLRRFNGFTWENLTYEAGSIAPTTNPETGTLWYNADFKVDIMYGTGSQWIGYQRKYPATNPEGVFLTATQPTQQSDGTALVDYDLWIDTSDLENYPKLYRYNETSRKWTLVDNTDNSSPFGIVFADARATSGANYSGNTGSYNYNSVAIADLLKSNCVDPDAPDPRTYPDGVLLFNTRFSTYNVKQYQDNYFADGGYNDTDYTMTTYTVGNSPAFSALPTVARWVSTSGNKTNGAPYMGRKAQRAMIVRAMSAAVAANDDIRSELVYYNLIAAPGYAELIDEMVNLNTDQKEISFIVGDTPARLDPSGTSINNWAGNANNAASNGEDGLVSASSYVGIYYPWGLSTDLYGNEVMVPPSSIALNVIAYNDQIAYPWYAPAGSRRGLVNNASSVGYLNAEGEYTPVILNQGQRDTLYLKNINPIAYIPGRGLTVYGQKTLDNATELNRVNTARLANYVKYNLDKLTKSFLFEQNDAQTRASAGNAVASFLNGLVGLRGLEDYVVVCDETNNTSERRDANELWIDVAIKPIDAIEFIYIPVRIVNGTTDLTTSVTVG